MSPHTLTAQSVDIIVEEHRAMYRVLHAIAHGDYTGSEARDAASQVLHDMRHAQLPHPFHMPSGPEPTADGLP